MEKNQAVRYAETQKLNYNTLMEKTIASLNGKKAPLLLHACCGPCSTACIERVAQFFDVTVYFYNPNIQPAGEYEKRKDTIFTFAADFNARTQQNIKIIEETYDVSDYDKAVRIDENPELAFEKEKGERCRRCYEFRMKKTFDFAASHGFDFFATTLTLSPYKDSEKVNEIGRLLDENALAGGGKTRYLYTDFKKKNGYLRSTKLSEEYGLYRQNYCGCRYGLANQIAAEKNYKS